jgi:Tfp pilus assembly protein PilO
VSLTARDRKILLVLLPLAILGAFYFLLLAPKRQEASKLQDQLATAQSERDTAQQRLAGLGAAKRSFATDYATVISLGKSIPNSVDMPSLLVQLDRAARGTQIRFTSIKVGARTAAATATGPAGATPAAGATTTPAAGATPTAGATPGAQSSLDTVPLDFEFGGSFFDLADFFHRMKRFVRVANDRIVVRGRLMTINTFNFQTTSDTFPQLKATMHATVYLVPKTQGVSAGATPQGPSGSAPAATPASGRSTAAAPTPPAATVTAR